MEKMLDKILAKLINLEGKTENIGIDLAETKKQVEYTYVRIDGFLVILDRHDTELAALNSAQNRIDARMTLFES